MNHLYLEITARCNLNCSHCSIRGQAQDLSEPGFDQIVQALVGFRNAGGEYLTLSGGEPGLRPDLPALIDEAHKLGFKITVFTNGRAISNSVLDALVRSKSFTASGGKGTPM